MISQGERSVVVTQSHGRIGGAHGAAQTDAARCCCQQAACKCQCVAGSITQLQPCGVQELRCASDDGVGAQELQHIGLCKSRQCKCAEVASKANHLTIAGIGQHHAGASGHRAAERGAIAVGQGQAAQGHAVANPAHDQHCACCTRIERDSLQVVACTVQGLGKRDVGTCGQCTVVGGVKRRVGGDHRIVCDVNRIWAAGAHRATAESTATCGIGFKVSWCVCETNRACVGGGTAVVHQHTAGGIE